MGRGWTAGAGGFGRRRGLRAGDDAGVRRTLAGISRLSKSARLLALLAVLAAAASGCTLGPKRPKSIPPPPNTDTTPNQGGIGTPITVRGEDTTLEVRVTGVLDPVSGSPGDTTLAPGARFVGVRLTLRNVGPGNYSESPLADSKLLTETGAEAHPVNLLGGPCGGRFPLRAFLRPGDRTSGCLPYELRRSQRPSRFEFALESGFAPEVGSWKLG